MEEMKFKFKIGGDRHYFRCSNGIKCGIITGRNITCKEDSDGNIYEETYNFWTHEPHGDVTYSGISTSEIFESMEDCFQYALNKINDLETQLMQLENERSR